MDRGLFLVNDMQTPPLVLSKDHICMKYTNQFLSYSRSNSQNNLENPKENWGLTRIQKKKFTLEGRRLLEPACSWWAWFLTPPTGAPAQAPFFVLLNPPSLLVIGDHWLAFLCQVCKAFKFPFSSNFEYKIDHISKTKSIQKFVPEHCTSSGTTFFFAIFQNSKIF